VAAVNSLFWDFEYILSNPLEPGDGLGDGLGETGLGVGVGLTTTGFSAEMILS